MTSLEVKSTCQELQLLLLFFSERREQLGRDDAALPTPKLPVVCEGPTPDIQHPQLGEAALYLPREL